MGVTLAIALLIAGCGSHPTPKPAVHRTAPADPWVLNCVDPTVENPALLWNGQVGLRMGRDGTGSGPMFLIDEFDTAADEKIRPLPNVLEGTWTAGPESVKLDPKNSSDYSQSIDMRNGLLTTSWSQRIGDVKVRVKAETILDPLDRDVAQRWTIDADRYLLLGFVATPKGAASKELKREQETLEWSWPPSAAPVAERDLMSPDIRNADPQADTNAPWSGNNGLRVSAAVDAGRPFTLSRFLTISESPNRSRMMNTRLAPARGDDFPDLPDTHWASKRTVAALAPFESFVARCKQTWDARWQTDIEIDGPVEDQQAVRSFLFYMRSSISAGSEMGISPMGLSNDHYNGHVFWDADLYVFPVLALIDPEEAKAIPAYRLDLEHAASANFQQWLADGRPSAAGRMGVPTMAGKAFGYKFPWESSVSGRETAPRTSRSRFEEHIGGDVAWMMDQAACLGLAPPAEAKQMIDGVASYYRWRSIRGSDGYDMPRVMSPDESHTGDNDLYTNLLAQWCQDGGSWDLSKANGVRYHLPRDNVSFLNYDDDAFMGYRQAAATLSIYPLQFPEAEKEAKTMMERFSGKVADYGPAMSDSIHALIWTRMGDSDRGYKEWQNSWRGFVKEPHLQFSEKRSLPVTYFTTGAAGCLQTVLYGFLGFRIDSKEQVGALWSTDLALGRILSVRPNLPSTWKSVKFKNFTVLGRRYTLIASRHDQSHAGGVQVIQGDK